MSLPNFISSPLLKSSRTREECENLIRLILTTLAKKDSGLYSDIIVNRCPTELCKDCVGVYTNDLLGNKLVCKCYLCQHGSGIDRPGQLRKGNDEEDG